MELLSFCPWTRFPCCVVLCFEQEGNCIFLQNIGLSPWGDISFFCFVLQIWTLKRKNKTIFLFHSLSRNFLMVCALTDSTHITIPASTPAHADTVLNLGFAGLICMPGISVMRQGMHTPENHKWVNLVGWELQLHRLSQNIIRKHIFLKKKRLSLKNNFVHHIASSPIGGVLSSSQQVQLLNKISILHAVAMCEGPPTGMTFAQTL